MFLYRHHLELVLKQIIRDARVLLHEQGPEPTGHHLHSLWSTTKAFLGRIESEAAVAYLSEADVVVEQFAALDPRSTTFRYPNELDGSKPLSALRHINYAQLRKAVEPACDLLGASRPCSSPTWKQSLNKTINRSCSVV